MQAIEGGTSQGGMVGGSGNIGMAPAPGRVVQFGMKTADNLNPQAPDCYFYYYSNCAKGSQCKFRHCSVALGTEEVCDLWLQGGECRRQVCAFRHSVAERQRSAIPCYWEGQTGCLKPHCPFLHTKPRPKLPGVFNRLDEFRKTEEEEKFSSLKVKSLEEIRQEKLAPASAPPRSQGTAYTHSHPHSSTTTGSYNLTYTPSHNTHSPSLTASNTGAATSFKLTSVLQTTGLAASENQTNSSVKKPVISQPHPAQNNAVMSRGRSEAVRQSRAVDATSKPTPLQSHVRQTKPPPAAKPAEVGSDMRVRTLPHAVEGTVMMTLQEKTSSLFGSQKNPSSVFSPNYQPNATIETKGKRVERNLERPTVGMKRGEREGEVGSAKVRSVAKIAAITWHEEGEGEGVREIGSKTIKLDNSTDKEIEQPMMKKVKVSTKQPGIASVVPAIPKPASIPLLLPKATSSPIKAPERDSESTSTGGKVGVAGSGRGLVKGGSGFGGDFHVKSLDEIRAEKRRRQQEGSTEWMMTAAEMTEEKEGPIIPTAAVKPQPIGRKIVRVKKRALTTQDQSAAEKEENTEAAIGGEVGEGRGGEVGEGGGGEGMREEGGEECKDGETADFTGVGKKARVEVTAPSNELEPFSVPAGKRRKLSRTPLSLVQATPTIDIPTQPIAVVSPQVTTADQSQPNPTKTNQKISETPKTDIPRSSSPVVDTNPQTPVEEVNTKSIESESDVIDILSASSEEPSVVGSEVNARGAAGVMATERKMSVSEMKAQIQSELRNRSDSEILSCDQLDNELAQWEEELDRVEEEGGDEAGLLDSKTDDDLMLELAEIL